MNHPGFGNTHSLPSSLSFPFLALPGTRCSFSKKASPPYKVSLATWPFLGPTAHLPFVLLSVVLEICFSVLEICFSVWHTEEKPGGPSVLFSESGFMPPAAGAWPWLSIPQGQPLTPPKLGPGDSLPPASCPPTPFLQPPSTPLTPHCCTSPEARLVAPNLRTSLLSPCRPGTGCRPRGWCGEPTDWPQTVPSAAGPTMHTPAPLLSSPPEGICLTLSGPPEPSSSLVPRTFLKPSNWQTLVPSPLISIPLSLAQKLLTFQPCASFPPLTLKVICFDATFVDVGFFVVVVYLFRECVPHAS